MVFPVLHGPFGEDGTVQGLLEILDVAYVGAGVLASALCMDKLVFKELMAQAGLPQVAYLPVLQQRWDAGREEALAELGTLGLPVFVKPARLGSSVGIAKVNTAEELPRAVAAALEHDPRVIVEAMSQGLEVECSVMGHSAPIASSPARSSSPAAATGTTTRPSTRPAGWSCGSPQASPPRRASGCERWQSRPSRARAARDFARVDFFVEGEEVLVNELNTMPGFTATSVFGKALRRPQASRTQHGYSSAWPDFALERHAAERAHSF